MSRMLWEVSAPPASTPAMVSRRGMPPAATMKPSSTEATRTADITSPASSREPAPMRRPTTAMVPAEMAPNTENTDHIRGPLMLIEPSAASL